MSKLKILDVNKTLTQQTSDLLNKVIDTQNRSQQQIQRAKALQESLLQRIHEKKQRESLPEETESAVQDTPALEKDRPALEKEVASSSATEAELPSVPAPKEEATAPADTKPADTQTLKAAVSETTTESVAVENKETRETEMQKTQESQEIAVQTPVRQEEKPQKSSKSDLERAEREAKERAIARAAKEAAEKRAREQAKFAHLIAVSNNHEQQQRERTRRDQTQQADRRTGDRPRYQDRRERTDNRGPFMDKDRPQTRPHGERPSPQRRSASDALEKLPETVRPQSRRIDSTPNKDKSYESKKRTFNDEAMRRKRAAIKEKGIISDDEFPRGSKKGRKPAKQQTTVIEPIKIEKAVITGDRISVKLFAEKTGKPVAEIIKKLFMLGMMCTINSEIDFDTASLIAAEFDIELEQKIEQTAEDVLIAEDKEDDESELVTRAPVVTIMGHVDHGKTSLLDAIRKTKVTEGEAGGITQHIGAYTIEINERQITFLDTPGHEAFTAMRARGAQATDIAILVVAADDGVMPQTIEAINHAKSAGVPIIVAINKMDKVGANPDKIKQALTEYELVAEEWGGDIIMVPVSAITGEGIETLLEMILLVADVQELKANPNRLAKGTIIEARLDKGRGPVATVLVQNGTLHIHDTIVAGTAYGRVRAMLNDMGESVKEAGPSQPIEVIGFSEVPNAGDIMYAVEQDKLSRQVAEERKDKQKAEKLKAMSKVSLDDLFNQIAEGQIKDLNLIVKADVQGSVEAVRQSLERLSNEEMRVRVIHGAVGAISESDVMLASASNAIIIGFNVRPESSVAGAAERENVDIRLYRVIYNAIEDIEAAMKGMLAPEFEEVVTGHAEIRQTYKVSSVGTVAGCYVQDGKVTRNASVRLLRDNIVIYEGKLSSLKRFKDDVKEVNAGYECGLTIDGYNDIKEGDVVEVYESREVPR